jgi:hypothetical protein
MSPFRTEVLDKWLALVKQWPRKLGKANLVRHFNGERLTMKEAIQAHCYECQGGEISGPCEAYQCSLINYSPYRTEKTEVPTQPDLFLGP